MLLNQRYANQNLDVVQYGIEDVNAQGTAVPATSRYFSSMFDTKLTIPTTEVYQAGNLYNVDEVPGKGHTEIDIKGEASVQDITSFLSTLLCLPVFATVSGSVHSATFAPNSLSDNIKNTLTFEKGPFGSGLGYIIPGCFGTDFELDFTPEKTVALTAKMMGRTRVAGQTLTPSLVSLGSSILTPITIDAYIATSEAGLSAGILVPPFAPLSVKFKHNKTASPVYSLTSSNNSFDQGTPDMPDCEFDLVMPRNAASDAYIDSINANTLYYMQIIAKGASIDGTNNNQVLIKAPVKFKNPAEGKTQSIYTNGLTARTVHRDDFNGVGGALVVVCQSVQANL